MIKINKQLRKYMVLISVISVVFITIISNISIYILFSNYIKDIRVRNDVKIIQYVEQEYDGYDELSPQFKMSLTHYILSEKVSVNIVDMNNNIVYNSNEDSMMNIPVNESAGNEDIEFKRYALNYNGKQVGTIEIGRPRSILSNFEDKKFLSMINVVFAVSFVFSVIISLFISSDISKKFLTPIHAISANAELIANGNYNKLTQVETNTYELNELSSTVMELSQKLDSQENLRKRMTNDLAHELRTPLSTVQSHIEAFMDGVWKLDIEKLTVVHDEISRLTKLINELAELSIVENNEIKLNKTNVDLSSLLNSILISFEPLLISKDIKFINKIQDGIYFCGDEEQLKRIFINIISNAYKYTNDGGDICISLNRLDGKIVVTVDDSGIGIPEEDIKHIFERFYRSDISRNRKTGGTGIGLTITKALVEAHEGTINITSEQEKGTTVVVEFTDK